jgi:acetoin utilization deacetylase AcuC-like enzyme
MIAAGPARTLVTYDPRQAGHRPPDHPESPDRLFRILEAMNDLPGSVVLRDSATTVEPRLLGRVHAPAYVAHVLSLEGQDGSLDAETLLSPGSVVAALAAAGGAAHLVDAIADGAFRNGFALTRPPGHHATADQGMGFCIFNNVAVAVARARERGLGRALVIDWDVHHGNGTQALFYDSPDTLVLDLHQDGLFPETGGAVEEAGASAGLGYQVNVPLPARCTDADYLAVLRALLPPLAHGFRPDLMLVSAGFDAHARDPEGDMRLSPDGFAAMAALTVEVADREAGGRLGFVLEGGYDVDVLGRCVRGCVDVLAGERAPAPVAAAPGAAAAAIAASVRNHHRRLTPALWR